MIYIFKRDFSDRFILSNLESLQEHIKYNGIGTFTMIVNESTENLAKIEVDSIIKNGEYYWLIQKITYENQQITINGSSLNVVLNQRAILEPVSIGNIESTYYDVINENLRGLDVQTDTIQGLTETFYTTRSEGLLLDNAIELCTTSGLGNKCYVKDNVITFRFYVGNDLTEENDPQRVVFSTERNNLKDLVASNDISNYKNVAVVKGQGEGDEREVVIVGEGTGADRFEMFVDARNEDSDTDLSAYGQEKLDEQLKIVNFETTILDVDFTNRYNLGDIVYCVSSQYQLKFKARISEMKRVFDQSGESITLTLGEPTLDMKGWLKKWL